MRGGRGADNRSRQTGRPPRYSNQQAQNSQANSQGAGDASQSQDNAGQYSELYQRSLLVVQTVVVVGAHLLLSVGVIWQAR